MSFRGIAAAPLGPGRRALSGLLACVYLTLALGAGVHVGDHDESGFEWLPSEYHHHTYRLESAGSEGRRPLVDVCVACQLSRLVLRLDLEVPRIPAATPVVRRTAADPRLAPSVFERSPRNTRGPPTA